VALSDQTLGFYLSLDTERWDAAVKTVDSDYKKFVASLDRATTKVSQRPQAAIDKLAASMRMLGTAVKDAQSLLETLDKGFSRGKPVKIPVQLVFQGGGFKQAVADAVTQALGRTTMTLSPQVPSRAQPGFKPGTTRATYRKDVVTPPNMVGSFVTAHGSPAPTRRKAVPGGSPRLPRGPMAYPVVAHGGEAITSATVSDLLESLVRAAATEGWGGVSTKVAEGAMRLRGYKKLKAAVPGYLSEVEGLQDLYMRRDMGEKVSKRDVRAQYKRIEESHAKLSDLLKNIKDPATWRAGQLALSKFNEQLAALHSNAEVAGTIFDPRHWAALTRHANPVVRNAAQWLATNRGGRMTLGGVGMLYAGYKGYVHSGGLQSAMTVHGMAGELLRSQPGMTREQALALAADTIGRTSPLISREQIAAGYGAVTGAGLGVMSRGAAAEYLAQAQQGYGLDYGVGADVVGQMTNRFGAALSDATLSLDRFAAQSRMARVSINELGQVASQAADAATVADYRSRGRGAVGRIQAHVGGTAALTQYFGGGQAGARLAAPISSLALNLQRGEIGAAQGGVMLFGGAAVRALQGKADTAELLRNVNYGLLRNMGNMNPMQMQVMAQNMGVPYETLTKMVSLAVQGKPITEASLKGPDPTKAADAAAQMRASLERLRLWGASGVDAVTGMAPGVTTELGFGHQILGTLTPILGDLALAYGSAKLATSGFRGVGRGAGAGPRAPGRFGRLMGSLRRPAGLPGRGPGVLGGVGAGLRAAGRVGMGSAPAVGRLGGLLGMGGLSAGGMGAGLATLGAGSLAVGALANLGSVIYEAFDSRDRAGRIMTAGDIVKDGKVVGIDALAGLAAASKEGGWGAGFTDAVSFSGARKTRVDTFRQQIESFAQTALFDKFKVAAEAEGIDLGAYMQQHQEDFNRTMAGVREQLAPATSINELAAKAGELRGILGDQIAVAGRTPVEASAYYLERIFNLLQSRG